MERMVTQTPNGPQVGQPPTRNDVLSTPSAQESAAQFQQVRNVTDDAAAAQGAQAPSPTQRTMQPLSRSTLVVAGATVAAVIALFGVGLTRGQVRPTVRRLMTRAQNIRAPLLFPVTLIEFARELLAERGETP